jgi:hypothetical protein
MDDPQTTYIVKLKNKTLMGTFFFGGLLKIWQFIPKN